MKHCKICGQDKKKEEFSKDKQKSDGLNAYCKACIRIRSAKQRENNHEYNLKYAKEYREKNRESLRIQSKERFLNDKEKYLKGGRESYHRNRDEIAKRRKIKRIGEDARKKENLRQKEWRDKNPEKYRAYIRKWQIANREKINAHAKVHTAVKNGTLKRGNSCMECGIECKTEGHHEDYSKPLDVIWLCRKCHGKKIEKVKV